MPRTIVRRFCTNVRSNIFIKEKKNYTFFESSRKKNVTSSLINFRLNWINVRILLVCTIFSFLTPFDFTVLITFMTMTTSAILVFVMILEL